ncbi:MAG TPA: hypothetical protein VEP67_10980 [Thiobacillaceae bacterium]|nr:hypothetical protein [Thiobacillaceae bacterium]
MAIAIVHLWSRRKILRRLIDVLLSMLRQSQQAALNTIDDQHVTCPCGIPREMKGRDSDLLPAFFSYNNPIPFPEDGFYLIVTYRQFHAGIVIAAYFTSR